MLQKEIEKREGGEKDKERNTFRILRIRNTDYQYKVRKTPIL